MDFFREKVRIIAEIGNNHLGSIELAHKSLDAAIDAGVDAVKFQLFVPELLITAEQPVLSHVPNNTFATQRERFGSMVLDRADFVSLADHAKERGVMFLCTPFDEQSADFLDPLVPVFKLASGDSSHCQLIDHVVRKGKPVLASTGLCDQKEVDAIVERLPGDRSMILHCVGAYPTPDEEASLGLISFYKDRYNIPVGYSDHTPDTMAALAAVAMGAVVIEKHFILDKTLPGGDRDLSLDGVGMAAMVNKIRRLELMLKGGPRHLLPSEVYGRENLRRSPYTKVQAKAGTLLGTDDIVFLRPELPAAFGVAEVLEARGLLLTEDVGPETILGPNNCELEK